MTITRRIQILLTGTVVVLILSFSFVQAQTVESLQAQIQALLNQVTALQAQLNSAQGGSVATPVASASCNFTRNLFVGIKGADVLCLQKYLNSSGFSISASGAGSPGNETDYFGSLTKSALARWQASNGVSPAVGYFGPISKTKYASLSSSTGGQTTSGGTTPTTTTATSNPLIITSVSPSTVRAGDIVTIKGEGFDSSNKISIVFGLSNQQIFGASSPDGKTLTFTFSPTTPAPAPQSMIDLLPQAELDKLNATLGANGETLSSIESQRQNPFENAGSRAELEAKLATQGATLNNLNNKYTIFVTNSKGETAQSSLWAKRDLPFDY